MGALTLAAPPCGGFYLPGARTGVAAARSVARWGWGNGSARNRRSLAHFGPPGRRPFPGTPTGRPTTVGLPRRSVKNPALVLAAGAGGLNGVRGPGSPPSPAPGGGNRGRAPGAGQHRPRGTGSGARAWRHVAVALVLGAETLTAGVAQCSGRASSQRSGCWLRFGCDVQPRTNSGAGGTRRRPSLGATPGNPDGPAMRSVSCGPRCQ